MNFQEILEVLKEKTDIATVGYGDFDSEELGLGACEMDVYKKGGEGEGEDWRRVHHFKDHDVYIQIKAFYASHEGVDFEGWEDCTEVRPKEKTVTVYE